MVSLETFEKINNVFLIEIKVLSNFCFQEFPNNLTVSSLHSAYKVLVFFAHWHEVQLDLGTTTFSYTSHFTTKRMKSQKHDIELGQRLNFTLLINYLQIMKVKVFLVN